MEPIVGKIAPSNFNEFLRRRLVDEVDKSFIELDIVLSQIENNFSKASGTDLELLQLTNKTVRKQYMRLLESLEPDCSF